MPPLVANGPNGAVDGSQPVSMFPGWCNVLPRSLYVSLSLSVSVHPLSLSLSLSLCLSLSSVLSVCLFCSVCVYVSAYT